MPTAIVKLLLEPRALNGGGTSVGTVTIGAPAPAGGARVTLSSSDTSVTVPASVTIAPGATTAIFVATTQLVSRDASVTVTSSVPGQSWKTTLFLWAPAANSFWADSDPNDPVGRGGVVHYTTATASFMASCTGSNFALQMTASGVFWSVFLSAPSGAPLRSGPYENARSSALFDPTRPGLAVRGPGTCSSNNSAGRFIVQEVEVSPSGIMQKIVATFEQRCDGVSDGMRGEVRIANSIQTNSQCLQ